MRDFEDLLNEELPSHFLESEEADDAEDAKGAEKEDNEESEDDSVRQSIVDKVEEALEDIKGVKVDKDIIEDFVSGKKGEIGLDDLDDDIVDEVYDAISGALDDIEEVKVDKDDDEVTISVKKESVVADIFDSVFESSDDDENYNDSSDTSEEMECGDCDGTEECYSEEDDDEDILGDDYDDDGADMDDVLDELENETDDSEVSDGEPTVDEPELDEVEDKKADDMLAMVATPILIKDELTAEESVQFYESVDAEIAMNEGLIEESDMDDLFEEGVFASPNRPFKMTKKARFRQLYELSVLIEARAHRDPLSVKLDRAYKVERNIKKQLRQRYKNQALKRAKGYLMRLMKSKSGVMKSLAKKILPNR